MLNFEVPPGLNDTSIVGKVEQRSCEKSLSPLRTNACILLVVPHVCDIPVAAIGLMIWRTSTTSRETGENPLYNMTSDLPVYQVLIPTCLHSIAKTGSLVIQCIALHERHVLRRRFTITIRAQGLHHGEMMRVPVLS